MQVTAAVAREPGQPFSIETLELKGPRPDEVLVRVVASGVCHTDVKAWKRIRPVPLPVVLGHEGAGIVEEVGDAVTGIQSGDPVVMTFQSCGACRSCASDQPAYCEQGDRLNFGAARADGTSPLSNGDETIHGPFFGQSSFASYALASQRNIVKVPDDIPLQMLGPLGCGVQTGAGAVLNSFKAEAGASIAVFGVGSVGLSAVMAAVAADCTPIIAIDVQQVRLDIARRLGAHHAINAAETDPVQAVRDLTSGGVDYALDTSGKAAVFRQAADSLRVTGTCGLIGGMAPGQEIAVEANYLLHGRSLRGIVQGDSLPQEFIPRLIDLYRQGRFPFDTLITAYPFEEINRAVADMTAGRAIKPVLTFA